jgi:WD40 repeat protein
MPSIIDLTGGSPEPDESPRTAAATALKSFLPRSQKKLAQGRAHATGSNSPTGNRNDLQRAGTKRQEGGSNARAYASATNGVNKSTFDSSLGSAQAELQRLRAESMSRGTPSFRHAQQVEYEVPGGFDSGTAARQNKKPATNFGTTRGSLGPKSKTTEVATKTASTERSASSIPAQPRPGPVQQNQKKSEPPPVKKATEVRKAPTSNEFQLPTQSQSSRSVPVSSEQRASEPADKETTSGNVDVESTRRERILPLAPYVRPKEIVLYPQTAPKARRSIFADVRPPWSPSRLRAADLNDTSKDSHPPTDNDRVDGHNRQDVRPPKRRRFESPDLPTQQLQPPKPNPSEGTQLPVTRPVRLSGAASLALSMNMSVSGTTDDAKAKSPYVSSPLDRVSTPSTPSSLSKAKVTAKIPYQHVSRRNSEALEIGQDADVLIDRARPTTLQEHTDIGRPVSGSELRGSLEQTKRPTRAAHGSPGKPLEQAAKSTPPRVNGKIASPSKGGSQNSGDGSHGAPYTTQEDELLVQLKEVEQLPWSEIIQHFPGRSYGSIQVRYSTKLKGRSKQTQARQHRAPAPILRRESRVREKDTSTPEDSDSHRRLRKRRNNEPPATNGFISWADVKKKRLALELSQDVPSEENSQVQPASSPPSSSQFEGARAFPKPVSRVLRPREIGTNIGRSWLPKSGSISDELKEHIFDDVGPKKYFKGTSSDVTCLAWSSNGRHFAAGSIAITDDRSMQYNKPNNLLLGDYERSILVELPEHHIPRPEVLDSNNPNGLLSMRQTQDPRLFMTVASVQFSPDGQTLYTAGSDCKARAYRFDPNDMEHASCMYELDHPASIDLMSVSNTARLATACHQSSDGSIRVYGDDETPQISLSPSRADSQTSRAIYPSALRWGSAWAHSNYLLAGFSIDSIDEERDIAGETCLWDIAAESRVPIHGITRNVFDVAWNPSPSPASHVFAVACTPGTSQVSRRTRSIVACFAPRQHHVSRVVELECPAFDINDVVYCPHDTNLIAVGATDSKVYVWDQRFANQQPLHILEHDTSLSVLDHDRDREIADTGIRFLSWGATSSRLYSGSSDGVVKIWNPYQSSGDAHVKDVETFTSAIMSGAFSPDYRELLIGEDQGRINSLSVGYSDKTIRSMTAFDLVPAPSPNDDTADEAPESHATARELVRTGQIAIEPMGALPKSQAVQGLNYQGPYLAPTSDQIKSAERMLTEAVDAQTDAHSRATPCSPQLSETGTVLASIDTKVAEAQQHVLDLDNKPRDAERLGPLAQVTQAQFEQARERHREIRQQLKMDMKSQVDAEAAKQGLSMDQKKALNNALKKKLKRHNKSCSLNCNYLPASTDDDNVPDSNCSRFRIPSALWHSTEIEVETATPDDLIDAGIMARCMTCREPAPGRQNDKRARCAKCRDKMQGLTAKCYSCFSPVNPANLTDGLNLCERCGFGCFRCGKPTFIRKGSKSITCDHCQLTWNAGALGYELERNPTAVTGRHGVTKSKDDGRNFEDEAHFGMSEILRLGSRWQSSGEV